MPTHRVPRAQVADKLAALEKSRERIVQVDFDGDEAVIRTELKVAAPGEQETRS